MKRGPREAGAWPNLRQTKLDPLYFKPAADQGGSLQNGGRESGGR
jgi:hypothetical protein